MTEKTITVSGGYFTQNCLPFVKMTLPKSLLWADQIIVLDMGSSDGTEEYCKSVLRSQDKYERRVRNTIPTLGFAEAHNYLLGMSDCEWAYASGINMCPDWTQSNFIKYVLTHTDKNVLDIKTHHIPPPPKGSDWVADMDKWMQVPATEIGRNRNFIRRNGGVEFKGYEHEEPYFGELNAVEVAQITEVRRFHYGDWLYEEKKKMRDAWMMTRAMRVPELKRYTHPWWYETHYAQNEKQMLEWASQFEQLYPEEI